MIVIRKNQFKKKLRIIIFKKITNHKKIKKKNLIKINHLFKNKKKIMKLIKII